MNQPHNENRQPPLWMWPALSLFTLSILAGYLQLQRDWWFEDDTPQMHYVLEHNQPLDYFLDKEAVKAFTMGRVFTPMLAFSFWIDATVAPKKPVVAYSHQILACLATVLALFAFLSRLTRPGTALTAACFWLLLPSSVSVLEFLSTRHYLEGLLACLLACCASIDAGQGKTRREIFSALCAALLCFLAALHKEIYVTSAYLAVASIFCSQRNWRGLGAASCSGLLYAVYRINMVGLGGEGVDALDTSLAIFPKFLKSLPFFFSGNAMGVFLAAGIIWLGLYLVKVRRIPAIVTLFWSANIFVMLLTIFPVSGPLYHSRHSLGTWYRVAFLLNTALLISGAWICGKAPRRWMTPALGALFLVTIVPGFLKAARGWDQRKASYFADADFYLKNPDKLLYSRLPAPWFLPGVHKLYAPPDQAPHFIPWRLHFGAVHERLNRFDTLWEATDKGYRPNPLLYRIVRHNGNNKVWPLHQTVSSKVLFQHGNDAGNGIQVSGIDFGDGKLTLGKQPDLVLTPRKGNIQLLAPIVEEPVSATLLLLANPQQTESSVHLLQQNVQGKILEKKKITLAPNSWEFIHLQPEDAGHVRLETQDDTQSCLLNLQQQGEWRLALPADPLDLDRYWVPHLPPEGDWQTVLRIYNPTDLQVTAHIGTHNQAEPVLEFQLAPQETVNIGKQETASMNHIWLELSQKGMVAQCLLRFGDQGNFWPIPLDSPSTAGLARPRQSQTLAAGVIMNHGQDPCRLVHRNPEGKVLGAWWIKQGDRHFFTQPELAEIKQEDRLEVDQPVTAFLLKPFGSGYRPLRFQRVEDQGKPRHGL